MRKLTLILFISLLFALPAAAQNLLPIQDWCQQGGNGVVTQGLKSQGTYPLPSGSLVTGTGVQASFPLCQVNVYLTGTTNRANIYLDNNVSHPLSNPFTANADGSWILFAAATCYDVTTISGATTLHTYTDVCLGGSGAGVSSIQVENLAPLFTTNVTNPTSTPDVVYTLSQAAANFVFGNCTGSLATPSYCAITFPMLPFTRSGSTTVLATVGSPFSNTSNVCTDGAGNLITCSITTGVSSFNTRTGAVVPMSGDYTYAMVTGAAPLASPGFTGTPTAPTAALGTNNSQIATTQFVINNSVSSVFTRTGAVTAQSGDYSVGQVTGAAPLASPALTGTPTAPTNVTQGDATTQIATDAFVQNNKVALQVAGVPNALQYLLNLVSQSSSIIVTDLGNGSVSLDTAVAGIITNGLLAQYPITETNGTVLHDVSGNGNNGTLAASTAAPTWLGTTGGLSFNSANSQFVSLPAALNSALTIQLFVGYQIANQSLTYPSPLIGNNTPSTSAGIIFNDNGGNGASDGESPISSVGAAFQTTAVGVIAGNHLISFTWDSVDHIYYDLAGEMRYGVAGQGTSAGHQTAGNFQLGGSAAGQGEPVATWFNGQIYYALFYNRVLSQAEIQRNAQTVINALIARGVSISGSTRTTDQLLAVGDSITAGESATPYTSSIALNACSNCAAWKIYNVAIPSQFVTGTGTNLSGMLSHAPVVEDTLLGNIQSAFSGRNVDLFWGGTNDVMVGPNSTPVSPAATFGNIVSYCKGRRANGWKVIVATMLSRGSTGFGGLTGDQLKNQLNGMIREFWPTFADGLADMAANPGIGADGASATGPFFGDQIHPTSNGDYNYISPIAQVAVNRLFGNHDFTSGNTYTTGAAAATAITAASESGNIATVTTTLNPPVGACATIAGVTPAGYNTPAGICSTVLSTSPTTFTYYDANTGLGVGTVFGTAKIPLQQDIDQYVTLAGSAVSPSFTLESCMGYTGQNLYLKNSNTTSPWVLTPFASETIDGAASLTMPTASSGNNPVVVLQSVLVSASASGCNWKRLQ